MVTCGEQVITSISYRVLDNLEVSDTGPKGRGVNNSHWGHVLLDDRASEGVTSM